MVNVGFFQSDNISTQDQRWYDTDKKIEILINKLKKSVEDKEVAHVEKQDKEKD